MVIPRAAAVHSEHGRGASTDGAGKHTYVYLNSSALIHSGDEQEFDSP